MRRKTNGTPGGVIGADMDQWRKWQKLAPAQRLDESGRLWLQWRELSKNAHRRIRLAVTKGFAGV